MSEERDFKGVWIPKEIWLNKELTIYEKAIYAEIDSLDGDKHCWASNEYLADFCQMSVPTISRAISHLIECGYIERVSFDGRQRILKVVKEPCLISEISLTNQKDDADLSPSEFLLYRENNKENNIGEPEPALSSNSSENNPRRNFRKEHEVLEDKLQSGEVIDAEKNKKKLSPAERLQNNCLGEINKRVYTEDEKELLREYFLWASSGTDVRKIKSLDLWRSKLNALEQIAKSSGDRISDIVQQSIDNKWYKFEQVNKVKSQSQHHEPLADDVVLTNSEVAKREYAKKLESDEGWY